MNKTMATLMGDSTVEKKIRVQFDFSSKSLDRLEALRVKKEATSKAEIIRNALRVYEYLIEKADEGYEIKLQKGDCVITLSRIPI